MQDETKDNMPASNDPRPFSIAEYEFQGGPMKDTIKRLHEQWLPGVPPLIHPGFNADFDGLGPDELEIIDFMGSPLREYFEGVRSSFKKADNELLGGTPNVSERARALATMCDAQLFADIFAPDKEEVPESDEDKMLREMFD